MAHISDRSNTGACATVVIEKGIKIDPKDLDLLCRTAPLLADARDDTEKTNSFIYQFGTEEQERVSRHTTQCQALQSGTQMASVHLKEVEEKYTNPKQNPTFQWDNIRTFFKQSFN